jgi:hypothetical protein
LRPFKKFFCDRDDIFSIPDKAFKIWMYHYKCEQADRKSWPSSETVADKCNLNRKTVFKYRQWLLDNGWLKKIDKKKGSHGQFSVPVFQVTRGTVYRSVVLPPNGTRTGTTARDADRYHGAVQEVDQSLKYINSEVEGTDMSFKNNISDASLKFLGIRIFAEDKNWDGLNAYKRVKGQSQTEEAFEKWAKDTQGEDIRYPLTEFLRVAERYFDSKFAAKIDVKPLVLELAYLSDGAVTFNQKQSLEIARLLESYPETEVKAAFVEFLTGLDDFSLKFAAKDFTEKAEQIIYTKRRQKQELESTNRLLETTIDRERKQVEEQLAKLPPEIDLSKFEL